MAEEEKPKWEDVEKELNNALEKEGKKEKKPHYQSRDGFERVPILRGFTEIRQWWHEINRLGGLVAGGYGRWCASPRTEPHPASDIDVFPCSEAHYEPLVKFFEETHKLEVKHENPISKTYAQPKEGVFSYCLPIQLIKPIKEGKIVAVGDVDTILSNFDFTVIRVAIVSPEECLVDADFLHDEKIKLLRLKNIHCPISSTLRVAKYYRKGYHMRPFGVLGLFLDWDNRGDDYRNQLVDFLEKANEGEGLSQQDIEELEALMRVD